MKCLTFVLLYIFKYIIEIFSLFKYRRNVVIVKDSTLNEWIYVVKSVSRLVIKAFIHVYHSYT